MSEPGGGSDPGSDPPQRHEAMEPRRSFRKITRTVEQHRLLKGFEIFDTGAGIEEDNGLAFVHEPIFDHFSQGG